MKELFITILILITLFFGETLAQDILFPRCQITISTPLDFVEVYSDRGTDADQDLSVWRPILPEGYYNLGYVFQSSYDKPTRLVWIVKAQNDGDLAQPTGWNFVWNDAGSGGDRDGSIWTPQCPDGYVAVGSVAIYMENGTPATNDIFPDIRCLRNSLATLDIFGGQNFPVWTDQGSGARRDVTIWSVSTSPFAFAFPDYGNHFGQPAWRLKTNTC